MRVVLDTNVLISAFLNAHGHPRRAYDAAAARRFDLVVSEPILAEVRRVLAYGRVARRIPADTVTSVAELEAMSLSVVPTDDHIEIRDPTDAAIVQTAIAAGADFIVTGDLDLLALAEYRGIAIVRAAEFLARLEAAGA